MDLKPYYIHYNKPKISRLLKEIKVIYTDVDGTLLGPDGSLFSTTKGRLSLYPAKALVTLKEYGIDVVMTSGRSRRQLFGDARLLGLRNYIAELGCQVVHNLGEKLYLNAGNVKLVEGSLYKTIEASGAPGILLDNYKGVLEYHTPWSAGRECTHVFRGFVKVKEANEFLMKNGFDWLQLIDNGIVHRKGTLKKDIGEIHAYHLLPKGIGKEVGLKRDLKLRGYAREEAIAVGDALSDLGLADEVSALFLVSNAFTKHSQQVYDGVKLAGNVYVTPLAMNLGFAQVAFELLKSKTC